MSNVPLLTFVTGSPPSMPSVSFIFLVVVNNPKLERVLSTKLDGAMIKAGSMRFEIQR
jgi:hypothetical protein